MALAIKALKAFAAAWGFLVALSFLVWGVQLCRDKGLSAAWQAFNPLHMDNLLLIAFSFAPAIVAYILADVLEDKK